MQGEWSVVSVWMLAEREYIERENKKGFSHSPQQQKFSSRKLRLTREQVWI